MISPEKKQVRAYLDSRGLSPFNRWLDTLRDIRTQQVILARVSRLRLGNYGDWKRIGPSLVELRINYGPGFRIYLGELGDFFIILLCGGDKSSQRGDLAKAKEYWNDYKTAKKKKEL